MIVAAAGLSLVPTRHELVVSDVDLFAWCALDAVGIPATLEATAIVTSTCGTCGNAMTVKIAESVPTAEVVGTVPTHACANPRHEFCDVSQFFCTTEHAQHWRARVEQPTVTLTLPQIAELGRAVWSWIHDAR